MAAKIKLDEPHRTYRPGDTIGGTVELTKCAPPVFLVLQGIAENRFVTGEKIKRHHKCRALLLYSSQSLLEAENEATKEESTINTTAEFSFQIPHHAQNLDNLVRSDRYWTYESQWKHCKSDPSYPPESGESFPTKSGHSLPPTCKFAAPRLTGIDCLVEYSIFATNKDPTNSAYIDPRLKRKSSDSFITYDRQPFWMTLERIESPWSELTIQKPRNLAFDAVYDGPTPASKFKRILNPAALPQTTFSISLIRPSYVAAGGTIRLTIEIEPRGTDEHKADGKKKEIESKILDLVLVAARCKMRPSTTLRAPDGREVHDATHNGPDLLILDAIPDSDQASIAEWSADDLQRCLDTTRFKHSQEEQDAVSETPPPSAPNTKRKITFPHHIPPTFVPTFSTYNILRRYRITINLQFKYGDQTKIVDYSFLPMQILPPKVSAAGTEVELHSDDRVPYKLEPEYSLILPEHGPDAFEVTDQLANLPVSVAQAACCVIL